MTTIYPNGSRVVRSRFHTRHIIKIRDCPCPDGKLRVAFITGETDNMQKVPARVMAAGRAINGLVIADDQGYRFVWRETAKRPQ